jgi:hypothetical protein
LLKDASRSKYLFTRPLGLTARRAVTLLDRLIREPASLTWLPLVLGRESEGRYEHLDDGSGADHASGERAGVAKSKHSFDRTALRR